MQHGYSPAARHRGETRSYLWHTSGDKARRLFLRTGDARRVGERDLGRCATRAEGISALRRVGALEGFARERSSPGAEGGGRSVVVMVRVGMKVGVMSARKLYHTSNMIVRSNVGGA